MDTTAAPSASIIVVLCRGPNMCPSRESMALFSPETSDGVNYW